MDGLWQVEQGEMSSADYVARRIEQDFLVDGDLAKAPWQSAKWSPGFVDMVTGAPGLFETRAAILWSQSHLYVAFHAEEPQVEARLTARDSLLFTENDLELFIDGGDCYYELEVNAANTVYEVLFVWRDAYLRRSRFDTPQFDLFDTRTYSFAGDYDRMGASFWKGTHPRGVRWAFTGFDLSGLQTAVQVQGRLNDASHRDDGWSLEIAIPWDSLELLSKDRALPPAPGDIWRMFLGRFQKMVTGGVEVTPHPAWVLTPHGIYDTHQPEKWSRIRFEL